MWIIKEEDLLSKSTRFSVRTHTHTHTKCSDKLSATTLKKASSVKKKKSNQQFSEQNSDAVKITHRSTDGRKLMIRG